MKQLLHLKRKKMIFIIGEYHTCTQGNKLKMAKVAFATPYMLKFTIIS